MFGNYFSSVFQNRLNFDINFPGNTYPSEINNLIKYQFNVIEIFDGLDELGFDTKMGPDMISAIFLNKCRY